MGKKDEAQKLIQSEYPALFRAFKTAKDDKKKFVSINYLVEHSDYNIMDLTKILKDLSDKGIVTIKNYALCEDCMNLTEYIEETDIQCCKCDRIFEITQKFTSYELNCLFNDII